MRMRACSTAQTFCFESRQSARCSQVEDPIPVDAAREVHRTVDIGEDNIPDGAEHRLASVEPGSRDRATVPYLVPCETGRRHVDVVFRFEVEENRRESMLFQDRRRGKARFEAMGLVFL